MMCTQEKCGFKKGSPLEGLCPVCAECGAEPHMINEDCVECWNCMKDEGKIRAGSPKGETQDKKEKEIEVITTNAKS